MHLTGVIMEHFLEGIGIYSINYLPNIDNVYITGVHK